MVYTQVARVEMHSIDLRKEIERHWRELRPKMVAGLKKDGVLETAIEATRRLTETAVADAIAAGMTPDQASDRFRNLWAFLPDERAVPDLRTNPARWSGADSEYWAHTGWCTGAGVAAWRARLKAERDRVVERLKRRLADRGNAGVPHERFTTALHARPFVRLGPHGNVAFDDVPEAVERIARSLLGRSEP